MPFGYIPTTLLTYYGTPRRCFSVWPSTFLRYREFIKIHTYLIPTIRARAASFKKGHLLSLRRNLRHRATPVRRYNLYFFLIFYPPQISWHRKAVIYTTSAVGSFEDRLDLPCVGSACLGRSLALGCRLLATPQCTRYYLRSGLYLVRERGAGLLLVRLPMRLSIYYEHGFISFANHLPNFEDKQAKLASN